MTRATSSSSAKKSHPIPSRLKKTAPGSLKDELHRQMKKAACAATRSVACCGRLHRHMLAALLNQTRCTLTNLLCIGGTQDRDWSADYRLYSKQRVDEDALFDHARSTLLEHLPRGEPLIVALDDTITRKTGRKIHGVGWKRDPLGPPFQTNLVLAQRYLQLSAAWPVGEDGQARMIPIDFRHAPTPPKPRKNAPDYEALHKTYREAAKQQNLNVVCLERIKKMREKLPDDRHLILNGDGSFTNKMILSALPEGATYLGRGRKDMALHQLPEPTVGKSGTKTRPAGRPRRYGAKAPTPEELRTDDTVAWQRVKAFAAGKVHEFKVKTMGPVLWRKTGTAMPLRIIVIAPLGYRLTKGGKMLYRQPAYLVCTDPELPLEEAIQYYLWRWGIEVNFREEKSLIGTGQAQVRSEASNQHLPASTVAAYALLWTSALVQRATGGCVSRSSQPKWRKPRGQDENSLPSTGELQRLLRQETWASAIRPENYSALASEGESDAKCEKLTMDLASHLFNAA